MFYIFTRYIVFVCIKRRGYANRKARPTFVKKFIIHVNSTRKMSSAFSNMSTFQGIISNAQSIIAARNNFVFRHSLYLDIQTVLDTIKWARKQSIPDDSWLPGIIQWSRLDYAKNTMTRESAQRLSKSEISDLIVFDKAISCNSNINDYDDGWTKNIVLIRY